MKKQMLLVVGLTVVVGLGGIALVYFFGSSIPVVPEANASMDKKPLFYRNPMNPAITSPVPAKDEMGMHYIPVYDEAPAARKKEREVLFWRNPMNPAITSPVFTQDEMGMDYLPVYANDGPADEVVGTVKIDPVTVQNIGVRTATAQLRNLSREVRAPGRITYDEGRLYQLHPRVEGWIEQMLVDTTGQAVKQGQTLLRIYSPRLLTAQEEYLLALESLDDLGQSRYPDIKSGAEEMVRSARQRLRLLNVPEQEVRRLERHRKVKRTLPVLAPNAGIITRVGVREGQYVTPKNEYYALADLSTVWVDVDVYEYELPWIAVGDSAQMRLKAAPGEQFEGMVTYIFPYAEAKTRTIKIRLEFANPKLQLKPDMFAEVVIQAASQLQAVVVPDEAVVRSGGRDQIFVVRAPGKFEPREVKLGFSSGGVVQVLEGVNADEQVVTSSLFLIDSESKLREATAKMLEAATFTSQPDEELTMSAMSLDDDMDMGGMQVEEGMQMDDLTLESVDGPAVGSGEGQ